MISLTRSGKKGFRGLLLLACFLAWLAFGIAHAKPPGPFLYRDVELADWGLTDPSQIGYLSIGMLHKTKGDELLVYDVRRQKPSVQEPSGPRGKAPSFEGGLFLVSHFHQGNTNRLGGYFNGFARSPSRAAVTIIKVGDGPAALGFSYHNRFPGFAGFWIHLFDSKAPPAARTFLDTSPFTHLTLSIRGERGGEELLLQMADRLWEKKEDSLVVGDIASFLPEGRVEKKWQRAWIPLTKLPTDLDHKELASLVLRVKGNASGRVFLKDLAFTTTKGVEVSKAKKERPAARPLKRGLWLWQTEKIVRSPKAQRDLLAFCKAHRLTDLFLQIPYEAKRNNGKWEILWDPSELRPLITQLRQSGLRVHALDGDPRYALSERHGRVLTLIQGIIRYNARVPAQARFNGIRYDNEPYLLPNFAGLQKQAILEQYLSLLEASKDLTEKANLDFGVDIPFWFDARNEFYEPTAQLGGRPMSERIIDIVDNVGIMDYRTLAYGVDGVIAQATGELQYAAAKGKRVYIGLETVQLPDETLLQFGPGGNGSHILLRRLKGTKIRIYWIPSGTQVPSTIDSVSVKGATVLGQTRKTHVPSDKLTFARKSRKDLDEVMRQAESEFLQYPSFAGFVIHSYESYRGWLENQQEKR